VELIVRHGEREEKVHLERTESGYRVTVGEASYGVDVAFAGVKADGLPAVHSLLIAGRQHEVTVRRRQAPGGGDVYRVTSAAGSDEVGIMDPLTYLARSAHDASGGGARQVTAYMPGRVVEILVEEGEEVAAGQGIVVLEAMKMKNEIQAEAAGVVTRILVARDQAVEGGDPLFEIG
jgi:biotin carboxyl carrier protein